MAAVTAAAHDRLDEAKAELIEKSAAIADHGRQRDIADFLAVYYRHVAADDLVGRDPVDVLGAALSQRALAQHRPQGTAKVRVFTPTLEEHGWSSGHSVVEVVTDDMPFLVDSISAELNRLGRGIHLVVHPQLQVRRDVGGRLVDVTAPGEPVPPGDGSAEVSLESWMHVEIDRETDDSALAEVAQRLEVVLRDVREAVEDWHKMRDAAVRLADELEQSPPEVPGGEGEVQEAIELLRWLANDHFTFLGFREYSLTTAPDGADLLLADPGTGLGVLRGDPAMTERTGRLPEEVRRRAREPRVLVLTKANARSTVHRPAYLDYIGVKRFDSAGTVVGERRFLGLFTSVAYTESITHIPVLRRKAYQVLELSGFAPTSHSGKDLLEILETYPRDELFQTSAEDLTDVVLSVLHLQERRQLRLYLRRDDYGRFMSCLVYLPRDRYTTQVRQEMERILADAFDGVNVDYTARVTESVLARLHFVVRVAPGAALRDVDPVELESRLAAVTRSWSDDFADALVAQCGEEDAAELGRTFADAFPEAYKEDFPARTAVADLRRLAALLEGSDVQRVAMSLYEPYGAAPGERRFKLFRRAPLSLSAVLPVLQNMGVEVVDERPYLLQLADGRQAWIYDFGLRYSPSGEQPADNAKMLFQDAFAAVWEGRAENDRFNALVLRAGLPWGQVGVLRAYAKYLRQAGATYSQDYIEQCLVANVPIARLLSELFEARFDPRADDAARGQRTAALVDEVTSALDEVVSLDQDRILRSLLGLITATLRTNYFSEVDGHRPETLALKLDSQAVPNLPRPRPKYEIWVCSPRVEGVHLRFGSVARGGLRWSDRREDFRTEVLGLVKAQMVKNTVIVPVGAKGGFVVKRPPEPTGDVTADREALQAEGIACYRAFISGMLDLTDNRLDGTVLPPPGVVRHDGDDPYLVVAADKGTATFSDIANEVAQSYGFWLGDAFASGGSAGYDHKAMGITARGAWESVKRHFRELGVDTQAQDFTVVGIGDMSGDVFGNGMLLSEHIRLVAAFDHRHVFVDPDPDPAASFRERRRLFDLPRSSWADYDPTLISAGGGVWPRTAKAVPLSPQLRGVLGIPDGVDSVSPAELIRACLLAPVDLLWNGGIGTYVKASAETHAAVGDKSNDAVRVDGGQLRARVVGEGGNLGLTQLGRIEYALAGGRVNTDAIDNSAGVDTSDHEVNIKILLDAVVGGGDLTTKQRNELLEAMTDEVADLVLRDNYEQNVLLGNARRQHATMLPVHARYIAMLEKAGHLDRALEFLPTDTQMRAREAAGRGLTSPELAVLVAYSKIRVTAELLPSELPDEPWYRNALRGYFPSEVVRRYDARLETHPLHREIVTTCVANDLVNRGGITFVYRAAEESGATTAQIARAYTVAREVFGFEGYWAEVEGLDNVVSTDVQTTLYLEARRLLDRSTRWLLQNRRSSLDVSAEIERFRPDIAELAPRIPELLLGGERRRLLRRAQELQAQGVTEPLARRAAGLLDAFSLLDVVQLAGSVKVPATEVAALYFAVSERFQLDPLMTRITELPRDDRWHALARSSLRYDLYAALSRLTGDVLEATDPAQSPVQRLDEWERQNAEGLARARSSLREIADLEHPDLATLSVALRVIRTLLRT